LNLTPGQLREILGLSEDTFRHWRRAIPPLASRNGYRPCFTHGDLMATAVVKSLVDEVGIKVGALSGIAPELFRLCQETAWAALERAVLVIEPAKCQLGIAASSPVLSPNSPIAIHVPCGPIVARVRARLLAEQPAEDQHRLRFPPAAIGRARRAGEQP
jgi:hypothetical protein